MCGIYGKLRLDGRHADPEEARRLSALLRHRGPDDAGLHVEGPMALGHRRLSIIDLSPLGRQPMTNEDGSLWIVFNGEIYNFADLRVTLEAKGHRFRSRTDTEVILHLYEEKGPESVAELRGMFAFAIWNRRERSLFLARDRIGKKPLFYHHGPACFAFASELASLVADTEIPREADRVAIHHYLTFQSVPHPRSGFRAIHKLPPGHWLEIRGGRAVLQRYWRLRFGPKLPARTPRQRTHLEELIRHKLAEAVRLRLVSDVPLGALLSGGVDSSGVVALMTREQPGRVTTFSVGFREQAYDELPYARRVATLFGTDHREFVLQPDMTSALPLLVEHFGEPFADPAALPLYFIAQTARREVAVALCGDGGDENFAGYHRHKLGEALRHLPRVPAWVARWLSALVPAGSGLANSRRPWWIARRLMDTLALPAAVRNLRFFGHFDSPTKAAIYTPEFAAEMAGIDSDDVVLNYFRESEADHPLDAILYADVHTYLADTLLPKVDITSMANSLEMRSPLLDHELMELAARLPASVKVRGLHTKWILKKALRPLLPRDVLSRAKMGFGVPLDRWLRHELHDMVRDTLLAPAAVQRGYFRRTAIQRLLDEQQAGRWPWHYQLYNLLMLELWHRRVVERR